MIPTPKWQLLLVVPPERTVDHLLAELERVHQIERGTLGGGLLWIDKALILIHRDGPFFEDDDELCAAYCRLVPSFDPETWGAISIGFDSLEAARVLLPLVADDPNIVVDTDCGYFARGDAFVARCRAEPDWDWRDED